MNIKSIKNMANKLRQGFKFSHLFCLSVGALIPIYADVLFLHEFNSSTVSAIMDTVMATAAISAALSVRNWLDDRMHNKAFEQAQRIIVELNDIYRNAFHLKSDCEYYANEYASGDILDIQQLIEFKDSSKILKDQCIEIEHKSTEIITLIKSLPSLGMQCEQEQVCYDFLLQLNEMKVTVLAFTCIQKEREHIVRKECWKNEKKQLLINTINTQLSFRKIEMNFKKMFSLIK